MGSSLHNFWFLCVGVSKDALTFLINNMKRKGFKFSPNKRKKRKGIHSKNASKGQNAYKKKYIGQGK